MVLYTLILYELATKVSVPKVALYAMAKNKQTIERLVATGKQRNHIREEKYEVPRKGTRSLIVPVLTITNAGLHYLATECQSDIPWIPDISGVTQIKSNSMTKAEFVKQTHRISVAALMADMTGAEEKILHISRDLNNPAIMSNCLENSLTLFNKQNAVTDSKLPVFYDSLQIKREVEDLFGDTGRTADVRGGQMAGVICCEGNFFIVYTSLPYLMYNGAPWLLIKDQLSFKSFTNEILHHWYPSDKLNGIIFVPDIKMFERVYREQQSILQSRSNRTWITTVENIFKSLTVIPISNHGVHELYAVLHTNAEQETHDVVEHLIWTGDFYPNKAVSLSIFPLTDPFDVLYHVCLHLDIAKLIKLQAVQRAYCEGHTVGILCRRWQVPFLEAVLTNIEVRDIDDYIGDILTILAPERTEPKMKIESLAESGNIGTTFLP